MTEFRIAGRWVGPDHPPLVIAEIGINHEGSVDTAVEMADAAVDAGAEVVKLQTHVIEDEMSSEALDRIPGNAQVSIYEIMQRCALTEEEEALVFSHVRNRGAICISTPFSRKAVDRLERFDVPAYKVGSGECSNYPLIKYISRMGKPVIMSTGMHTIDAVRPSVEILRDAGVPFALLHTTNLYPTPPSLVRLLAMRELAEAFPDAVIGLSDHSLDNFPALGAVALGASVLERHFTDRADREGPDIICSMTPSELTQLIRGANTVHTALRGGKGPAPEEEVTRDFALSSVVATKDISRGETLTEENIWVMRPAGGDFGPAEYESLLGRQCLEPVVGGRQLPRTAVGAAADD